MDENEIDFLLKELDNEDQQWENNNNISMNSINIDDNLSNEKTYDSLRPGKSVEDPTVTNIKALRYNSTGTIDFKINFDDEYSDLRLAQKKRKIMCKIESPIIYGQLHAEELKIPKSGNIYSN